MTIPHVFVETNFLFSVFRMPSQRHRDALVLHKRFEAGEIKLYVPYLCLQEVRNLIAQNLPRHRCIDLFEFHRYADSQGMASWNFEEVKKLLDAAMGEVNRTKAVYKQELASFAKALGEGLLHGTDEVFDLLEVLDSAEDNLKNDRNWFQDAMVLCSVLVKAKQLRQAGAEELYFASLDRKAFQPTETRPQLTQYYSEAGLVFVPGFILPESPSISP